jgi:hypothetical protein
MRVNCAEYWLSLREFMTKYDAVHFSLRSGKWIQRDPTLDEMFRIEAYNPKHFELVEFWKKRVDAALICIDKIDKQPLRDKLPHNHIL